jgi:hypothetical protein
MHLTTATLDHKVVSRTEWLRASSDFLAKEKELTRLVDELARQRRELPWAQVEKEYVHGGEGPHGPRGSIRRAEPACDVSLHVRSRLARGLPGLLLRDGPHARRDRASRRSGCLARSGIAGPG